jgi:GxxExxY protein
MIENDVCTVLLDAAFKIHRALGPGLLESVYHECLYYEAGKMGLKMRTEVAVPVYYDGIKMPIGFRADLLANNIVIAEIKSLSAIADIHLAQLLTYLRLTGIALGIIINFNVPLLKDGIRRVVNNLQ